MVIFLASGCTPAGPKALSTGERLLQEGRASDAIPLLKEAVILLVTNAPACAQAWNHLGLAYHYSGRLREADQAYQNALKKDFNLVVVHYNRGCLLLEENQLAGAIAALTTYTVHRPKAVDGWLKLGSAQLRARQFDAADVSFRQAVALNQRPSEAYNGLGLSQAFRRRPHEAFQYFHAALKSETNYPPALLNQAIVAQVQLNDRPLALQKYHAYLDATTNAANETAVMALVKQFEAELHPPPMAPPTSPPVLAVTVTNPPTRITNVAAVQPAVAPTHTTNVAAVQPVVVPTHPTNVAAVQPALAPTRTNPPMAIVAPPVTVAPPPAATNLAREPRPQPAAIERPLRPPPVIEKPQVIQPEPLPPLEVVTLADEPEVKPAQKLTLPDNTPPAAPPATAPATAPATPDRVGQPATPDQTLIAPTVQPSPVPAPVDQETGSTASPASSLETRSEKKSLLQKLNPLGWFGSRKKQEPESKPSPLAKRPVSEKKLADATAKPASASTVLAPRPRPEPPVFPRFTYRNPPKPAGGDHALAMRSFTEGIQAQRNSRPGEALAAYKKAVEADPAFFEAHYNLGVAACEAQDYAAALPACEDALAIKPEDANARFNFSIALEKAGYPVDAAHELETLLARAPDEAAAHFALANLQVQTLLQPEKARAHYQRVLQLQPRHPQAAAIRGWLAANP